jgi:hypothetical protein
MIRDTLIVPPVGLVPSITGDAFTVNGALVVDECHRCPWPTTTTQLHEILQSNVSASRLKNATGTQRYARLSVFPGGRGIARHIIAAALPRTVYELRSSHNLVRLAVARHFALECSSRTMPFYLVT